MFIKLRCRQLAQSSVIKHAGNHYSELLIATKITLFAAGDEIKIALAYNTGSTWHPQGAGRLEYSSTTLRKSRIVAYPWPPHTARDGGYQCAIVKLRIQGSYLLSALLYMRNINTVYSIYIYIYIYIYIHIYTVKPREVNTPKV